KPRELTDGLADALWQRLLASRLLFRRSPVGVELARDDLTADRGQRQVRMTARARTPVVTVTGHPAELMLWALGRTGAAPGRHHRRRPPAQHGAPGPVGALAARPPRRHGGEQEGMEGVVEVLGIDIGGSGIKVAPADVTAGALTRERIKVLTPQPATPKAVA